MKLILLFIFFVTKLTAQDSTIQSGIEAPLPSFSKKFTVDDVQASTDKNYPSTIKINIKGEAKNISFPIKLPFKAEATNPNNSKPLNQAEPSAAVAIEDKDGGVYEVDDKGKTRKIGNIGSELPPTEYKEAARKMNVRLGRATTPKLLFKALASEPLAFDEWQPTFKGKSIIEKEYQKIGENYYVPIKLIPAGMTGKVQVDLNGINKDSLIFKTPNGSIYTLQENNILSIAGAKNGDGIELYAQNKFDSTIIYGKLNIYGYEIKNLKVNLVPVNSTATIYKEKLENELNKIYYPYGVSVSLNVQNKIEDKSWDLNQDGKLDVGETGILNFRTEEMKAVHRLNENKNPEEIYLYIMQTPSKEGVEGDMPLGSQYGFLFGEPNARTLSHEIAHGYFQLKHSFDESIALQKSSTNNLMDYANGKALYKYQWDLVHDRGLMIAKLWQSDSAGEMQFNECLTIIPSENSNVEGIINIQNGKLKNAENRGYTTTCTTSYLYHLGSQRYKQGWYKESEYAKIFEEVVEATTYLNSDLIICQIYHKDRIKEKIQILDTFLKKYKFNKEVLKSIFSSYNDVVKAKKNSYRCDGSIDIVNIEMDLILLFQSISLKGLEGLLSSFKASLTNGANAFKRGMFWNVAKVGALKGTEKVVKGVKNLPSIIRQLATKPSYKPHRSILSKQNKTTTFIGKWSEEINGKQNGLQKIYNELSQTDLNIYMQSGKFDHPGGFNMLSIEGLDTKVVQKAARKGILPNTKAFDDFIWDEFNRPWLENALQRGDDIVIWSDPINSATGFYKRELEFINSNASKYGYNYNTGINTGTFSK